MAKPSGICSSDDFEAQYVQPREGRTLVVGSKIYGERIDRRTRYQDAVGVDLFPGLGVDIVLDLEEALPVTLGRFAHIDCISVLEHSRRPWLLAANIERLLEPGGTLYVGVPFVWRIHAYPSDYWRFTVEGVRSLFPVTEWTALQMVNQLGEKGIPNLRDDRGALYFARTEIYGFGHR